MSYHKLSDEQKSKAMDMGFVPLFSDRETIEEAQKYFDMILKTLDPADQMAVVTAINVFENTKILVTLKEEEEVAIG